MIRDRGGRAEWVDVKKGVADGDLVEVIGNLKAGDRVVRRRHRRAKGRNGTTRPARN